MLNSWASSATGHTPFEIIYRYILDFTILIRKHSNILALDEHFKHMTQIQKEAEASLCQAKLYWYSSSITTRSYSGRHKSIPSLDADEDGAIEYCTYVFAWQL